MSKAGAVEKVLGGRAATKEVQMTKTRIGCFAISAAIRSYPNLSGQPPPT